MHVSDPELPRPRHKTRKTQRMGVWGLIALHTYESGRGAWRSGTSTRRPLGKPAYLDRFASSAKEVTVSNSWGAVAASAAAAAPCAGGVPWLAGSNVITKSRRGPVDGKFMGLACPDPGVDCTVTHI